MNQSDSQSYAARTDSTVQLQSDISGNQLVWSWWVSAAVFGTVVLVLISSGCDQGPTDSPLKYEMQRAAGLRKFDQQQYSESIEALSDAIRLLPPGEPKSEVSIIYTVRGVSYIVAEDLEKADSDLNQAIEMMPGNAYALFGRAKIKMARGDAAGAIEDLSVALNQDPEFAHAYVDRARNYLKQQEFALALEDINQAISIDEAVELSGVENKDGWTPLSFLPHELYLLRGQAFEGLGESRRAAEDKSKAEQMKMSATTGLDDG